MALRPAWGSIWELIKFTHTWEMLSCRTQRDQWGLQREVCHTLTVSQPDPECLSDQTLWQVLPGQSGLEALHTMVFLPHFSGERVKSFTLTFFCPHCLPCSQKGKSFFGVNCFGLISVGRTAGSDHHWKANDIYCKSYTSEIDSKFTFWFKKSGWRSSSNSMALFYELLSCSVGSEILAIREHLNLISGN